MEVQNNYKIDISYRFKSSLSFILNFLRFPYVLPSAYFGQSSGMVMLENVDCSGSENDIASCSSYGWGHSDCTHDRDVAVLCGLYFIFS